MSDISELHYNSLVLKDFHIKTASYKHAIQEVDEKWELFIPTHFVYEFFIFNTLYSIDWKQSLSSKKIIHYRNFSFREEDKQLKYIDFIFNENFVSEYIDKFIQLFFLNISATEIEENILKNIEDDRNSKKQIYKIRGSVRDSERDKVVSNFKYSIRYIIKNKKIDKTIIKNIITFIYKVRCNIFHGVKCFKELNSGFEREKLAFYSNILIAVNQMLFSYLDYLKNIEEGTEDDSFQELWEKLAKK